MEQRRLSCRSPGALRRLPHAAQSRFRPRQPPEIRRRGDRRLARLQHHSRHAARASAPGATTSCSPISRPAMRRPRHGVRADGRGGGPQLQPDGSPPTSTRSSPICEPCRRLPRPIAGDLAPPAPASPQGRRRDRRRRGQGVFEGACAGCHNWTGVSAIIALCHTHRRARGERSDGHQRRADRDFRERRGTRRGNSVMPAFGAAYSDMEIAAVANYVTARFGSAPSSITAKDVASLRSQTSR